MTVTIFLFWFILGLAFQHTMNRSRNRKTLEILFFVFSATLPMSNFAFYSFSIHSIWISIPATLSWHVLFLFLNIDIVI